jgi:antitoxin PrlF
MTDLLSSVSPKGQVTIPAGIRAMLGVRPRDKVAFRVEDGVVKIAAVKSPLDASYRAVPPLRSPVSLEEMEEIVSDEAAQQAIGQRR